MAIHLNIGGIFGLMAFGVLGIASLGSFAGYLSLHDVSGGTLDAGDRYEWQVQRLDQLASAISGMSTELAGLELAQSDTEISAAYGRLRSAAGSAGQKLAALGSETERDLAPVFGRVTAGVDRLRVASDHRVRARARIRTATKNLQDLTARVAQLLADREQTLGEAAIAEAAAGASTAGAVLESLIDRRASDLQTILSTQADAGLLTGIGLAQSYAAGGEGGTFLADPGAAAANGLERRIQRLSGLGVAPGTLVAVQLLFDRYHGGGTWVDADTSQFREELLSIHADVDRALSRELADRVTKLQVRANVAAEDNRVAAEGLAHGWTARLRNISLLQAEVSRYAVAATRVVLAPDEAALADGDKAMRDSAVRLSDLAKAGEVPAGPELSRLVAGADGQTGLGALRRDELAAERDGRRAAAAATAGLAEISDVVAGKRNDVSSAVTDAAAAIEGKLVWAGIAIVATPLAAAGLILMTLYLIRCRVFAPLTALSTAAERLAGGDMTPLQDLRQRSGEIGRMGRALDALRDNLGRVHEQLQAVATAEVVARTEQEATLDQLTREISVTVSDAARGDFSRRVERTFDQPAVRELALHVNGLMDVTERSLTGTRVALRALSDADFAHRVNGEFHGEFAALRDAANGTFERLAALVRNMGEAAGAAGATSACLTQSAQEQLTRARDQASGLEQNTVLISEVSVSLADGMTAMAGAEDLSRQAADRTSTGREAADQAIATVTRVRESAGRVSEIVAAIEAIAFQTGLLALNAGVEAARAGDSGRGFAVVAQEVAILAQRSRDASGEIARLNAETSRMIAAGVEKVTATGTALRDIDATVKVLLEALGEMSDRVKTQVADFRTVEAATAHLRQAVRENAVFAERFDCSAQDLCCRIGALSRMTTDLHGDGVSERRSAPVAAA